VADACLSLPQEPGCPDAVPAIVDPLGTFMQDANRTNREAVHARHYAKNVG
jgi:hypothetical protein